VNSSSWRSLTLPSRWITSARKIAIVRNFEPGLAHLFTGACTFTYRMRRSPSQEETSATKELSLVDFKLLERILCFGSSAALRLACKSWLI